MRDNICLSFYKDTDLIIPIWDVTRYYYNEDKDVYFNDPEERLFSFDRVKIYDYKKDYPHNLTKEELKLFEKYKKELRCIQEIKESKSYVTFHKIKGTDKIFKVEELFETHGMYFPLFGNVLFSFDKKIIYGYYQERVIIELGISTLTEEEKRLMYE